MLRLQALPLWGQVQMWARPGPEWQRAHSLRESYPRRLTLLYQRTREYAFGDAFNVLLSLLLLADGQSKAATMLRVLRKASVGNTRNGQTSD